MDDSTRESIQDTPWYPGINATILVTRCPKLYGENVGISDDIESSIRTLECTRSNEALNSALLSASSITAHHTVCGHAGA